MTSKACWLVWLAVCLCPPVVLAEATKVTVLLGHDTAPYRQAVEGFRAGLAEQGMQPGYELAVVDRVAAKASAAPPPQVILAVGGLAVRAAVADYPGVPVVATLILDSRELRGVHHATGVTLEFPAEVQWRWFRRLLPRARALGVLYHPELGRDAYRQLAQLAGSDGVELVSVPIARPEALPEALKQLPTDIDALLALGETQVLSAETAREILLFSFRNRVPFIGLSENWVKAGGLYALDRDYADLGHQAADLALAILKGAHPASLPPVAPRRVVYSLNLKTAEHMKLEFADDVIRAAKQVFR